MTLPLLSKTYDRWGCALRRTSSARSGLTASASVRPAGTSSAADVASAVAPSTTISVKFTTNRTGFTGSNRMAHRAPFPGFAQGRAAAAGSGVGEDDRLERGRGVAHAANQGVHVVDRARELLARNLDLPDAFGRQEHEHASVDARTGGGLDRDRV